MIEKKIWRLLPNSKKLTFLVLLRLNSLTLWVAQIFRLFEVKDPYRPVLSIILWCFRDFCNILHHITGVSISFQPQPHTDTSHAYPQYIWYCPDIGFFFNFRLTTGQIKHNNGIIFLDYVKLTKAYLGLGVACLIKKA